MMKKTRQNFFQQKASQTFNGFLGGIFISFFLFFSSPGKGGGKKLWDPKKKFTQKRESGTLTFFLLNMSWLEGRCISKALFFL